MKPRMDLKQARREEGELVFAIRIIGSCAIFMAVFFFGLMALGLLDRALTDLVYR